MASISSQPAATGKHVHLSEEVLQEHERVNSKPAQNALQRRRESIVSQHTAASSSNERRGSMMISDGRRGSIMSRGSLYMKTMALAIGGSRRMSRANALHGFQDTRPKVRLENTYRMKPREGATFSSCKTSAVIKDVLESRLAGRTYDPASCRVLSMEIASSVKSRVQEMDNPRYKVVCNVVLGSVSDQGIRAVSRCLWDPETDDMASYSYKNGSLFATVTVHAVYFE